MEIHKEKICASNKQKVSNKERNTNWYGKMNTEKLIVTNLEYYPTNNTTTNVKYLIHTRGSCEGKFWQFRLAEIDSLVDMYTNGKEIFKGYSYTSKKYSSFILLNLPNDDILKKIVERSISIRTGCECLSIGRTVDTLLENINKNINKNEYKK